MKIVKFATGMAIGYVLGSRAGRDKYQQIVAAARKAQEHPAVVQAQQKAKQFLGSATDTDATVTDPQPAVAATSPAPRPAPRTPKIAVGSSTGTVDPLA